MKRSQLRYLTAERNMVAVAESGERRDDGRIPETVWLEESALTTATKDP
jgi:hypothetical protein